MTNWRPGGTGEIFHLRLHKPIAMKTSIDLSNLSLLLDENLLLPTSLTKTIKIRKTKYFCYKETGQKRSQVSSWSDFCLISFLFACEAFLLCTFLKHAVLHKKVLFKNENESNWATFSTCCSFQNAWNTLWKYNLFIVSTNIERLAKLHVVKRILVLLRFMFMSCIICEDWEIQINFVRTRANFYLYLKKCAVRTSYAINQL